MALSRAVFDGDVLVYKAGFSVEKRFNVVTGGSLDQRFSLKKDAEKEFARLLLINHQANMYPEKEVGELRQAQMNLLSIVKKAVKDLKVKDFSIYLSPEDVTKGVRFKTAVTKPYKGNRTGEKPVHYKALRAFAIRELETVVAPDDLEADDLLGMASKTAVVCSIDKDLMMVPGTHYNLTTGDITQASHPGKLELIVSKSGKKILKGNGFKWFCAQMLLGDAVDNIVGIDGVGPVAAYKILDKHTKAKDLWECIHKVYTDKGLSEDRITENKVLLWINQPQSFEEILEEY